MSQFYELCQSGDDLGQGDIFPLIPFVQLNSTKIIEMVPEGDGFPKPKEFDLLDYVGTVGGERNVITKVSLLPGIIITQNCDVLRSSHISFCAIKKYEEVEKQTLPNNPKRQIEYLTDNYKHKAKYFYLPSIEPNGFKDRMAVDFSCIYQLDKDIVEQLKSKRLSRLGDIPLGHFRVKLGHYFERFAYDPWYVLNKDEFKIYLDSMKDYEKLATNPCEWQK